MLFRRSVHPSQADLSAYVDGELEVYLARSVASHANVCRECTTALDALRQTKAILADLPRAPLTRSFLLSAEQATTVSRRPEVPRPSALRFAPALSLAALAVLLVVDVSLPGKGRDEAASNDLVRPGIAAKSAAELADGAGAAGAVPSAATPAPAVAQRALNADAAAPAGAGPVVGAAAALSPSAPNVGAVPFAAQAEPQAAVPAPPVAPGPEGRAAAPEPSEPAPAGAAAPVPFSATTGPGVGGATAPVLPPAPQPQAEAFRSQADNEGSDKTVLRLFEVIALTIFVTSTAIVVRPHLKRKEPR